MPSIHLYAELLLNIRTINLFATLPTKHTSQSKAEISADRSLLTFQHEGQEATIQLPSRAASSCSTQLLLPPDPSSEISFRIQPELSHLEMSSASENITPWSACDLTDSSSLSCSACGCTLVTPNSVHAWKDLPSEHWAEMMDFWHCHKPDERHVHDLGNDPMQKGYAASNHVAVRPGTGFVDLLHLFLSPHNCCSIMVRYILYRSYSSFLSLTHYSRAS